MLEGLIFILLPILPVMLVAASCSFKITGRQPEFGIPFVAHLMSNSGLEFGHISTENHYVPIRFLEDSQSFYCLSEINLKTFKRK